MARDFSTFRAPGATSWRRIDDHAAAALILGHLVARRRAGGGEATVFDLAAAGWPTHNIRPASARNRVYVALAWLRSVGLRNVIVRRGGGYLLDPGTSVEVVSPPRRVDRSASKCARD